MNNADLNRYNDAKTQLRTLVKLAVDLQRKTQKEILKEKEEIISGIFGHNKKTPRYLAASLNNYFDGFYDAMIAGHTVFLYNIEGQFYKLGHSYQKGLDFPTWDTLPREKWGSLKEYGGIYWRKTLKPFA